MILQSIDRSITIPYLLPDPTIIIIIDFQQNTHDHDYRHYLAEYGRAWRSRCRARGAWCSSSPCLCLSSSLRSPVSLFIYLVMSFMGLNFQYQSHATSWLVFVFLQTSLTLIILLRKFQLDSTRIPSRWWLMLSTTYVYNSILSILCPNDNPLQERSLIERFREQTAQRPCRVRGCAGRAQGM